MKRIACPICGEDMHAVVMCPKEKEGICEKHCSTCQNLDNRISVRRCTYKKSLPENEGGLLAPSLIRAIKETFGKNFY